MIYKGLLAFGLLALYLVASVHTLRLDAGIADALVAEDGIFEWLGAVCLFAGAGFVMVALIRLRAAGEAGRLKLLAYLGVALFLFVAGGEEISWGQRVLGIETPDAVREINAQGETNLHNLYGDENGQNASVLIYQAFWLGFGVLLPFAALLPRLGGLLRRHLPVLPVWLALLFVGQQLLWTPVRAEFRADPGAWNATYRADIGGEPYRVETQAERLERGVESPAGLGEIMEANLQVLLGVGGLVLYLAARRTAARRRPTGPRPDSVGAVAAGRSEVGELVADRRG